MSEDQIPARTMSPWHGGVAGRHPTQAPDPVRRSGGIAAASAGCAAVVALGLAVWLSTLVHPGTSVREVALFVHLGSLVFGFGAVLVADYFFVLWAFGRIAFADAVASTTHLHLPVWSGLFGLMASGALLEPDLRAPPTVLKLTLVVVLTLNGVQAMLLSGRMGAGAGEPPHRLLVRGAVTTAVSQLCWWGAIIIGFLTVNR